MRTFLAAATASFALHAMPAHLAVLGASLAWHTTPGHAQVASSRAIDIPAWFGASLLDLREEVRAARAQGRRLMVYFGQDGCPYCTQLMQTNFSQQAIVEKTRRDFVAIALNLWGDQEVTWVDGRVMSEKQLAGALRVQFTPTLLFLDEAGAVIARLNGYYPPHRFAAALDFASGRAGAGQRFDDYMRGAAREAAHPALNEEDFFLSPPHDLRRPRLLAVLFETPYCAACDELHREGLKRPEVRKLLARFDVARFALSDQSEIVTPRGARMAADAFARELGVAYTPTIVFFAAGEEVLRLESYLRPFHLAGALDYVASGAWRKEASFQRFLQARAERLRARGEPVDLWR